jgi:glycerol-3-phosphate acyltransferase PlsY
MVVTRLKALLIGYLCGCFPTGYLVGKKHGIDIRKHGSGNTGATNTLRTLGWKAGIVTFFGECMKSVVAVLLVRWIFSGHDLISLLAMYAGMGVVLGHNYPVYMNFKGGKGIAATAGLILATNPIMFLIVAAVFASIVLTTRYVSLGSLVVMVVFMIEVVVYGQMGGFALAGTALYEIYAIALFLAVLGFVRHKANIKRLLSGTENKFGVINKVA